MVAKIEKGVIVATVKRTLDSLYASKESGVVKDKTPEEQKNITMSIDKFEDILKKLNKNNQLTTEDYGLIYLSLGTNASLMELKAEELLAAVKGMRKYADNIQEYLKYIEKQPENNDSEQVINN